MFLSGKSLYLCMTAADFDSEGDLVPKASPSGDSRPFTQAGSNITFSLLSPPVTPPQSSKKVKIIVDKQAFLRYNI